MNRAVDERLHARGVHDRPGEELGAVVHLRTHRRYLRGARERARSLVFLTTGRSLGGKRSLLRLVLGAARTYLQSSSSPFSHTRRKQDLQTAQNVGFLSL